MTRQIIRVGIIGAGASGLAQLKQILEAFVRPEVKARTDLEVVVFEKQAEVGGVWFADEDEEKRYLTSSSSPQQSAKDGVQMYIYPPEGEDPSPMYKGLRTNLPHDLMAFRSLPMPTSFPTFPTRAQIQSYLISYAKTFDLYPHIKLQSIVRRLYLSSSGGRRWVIEYAGKDGQVKEVNVDFVCCANGHYADGWIPKVPGLSSFKGEILHSRYFRSAEDYKDKKILVVGSFASGGDISRLLAAYNLGMYTRESTSNGTLDAPRGSIEVHISCSAPSQYSVDPNDPTMPWGKYVTYHPIIDRVTSTQIYFEDDTTLAGVDAIIYATGYNFAMPFAKAEDRPWSANPIFNGRIGKNEREGGDASENGGLKGLGVKGLDELMLFLEGDRSICFPVLQYQVVPFPLAETQTRLSSLLWAGLLPSFPSKPEIPRNDSNPYSSPPAPPPSKPNGALTPDDPQPPPPGSDLVPPTKVPSTTRKVVQTRQTLVFGAPYEWEYQEYLMNLMHEGEAADGGEMHWRAIEQFRRDRRADSGLRKRTVGY